jgi:hypothetical protein
MRRIKSVFVVAAVMAVMLILAASPALAQANISTLCFDDVVTDAGVVGDVCNRFIETPSGIFNQQDHFTPESRPQGAGQSAPPHSGGADQVAFGEPGTDRFHTTLTPSGNANGASHQNPDKLEP